MFSINPIQINLRHSSSKLLFIVLAMAGNMDLTTTVASVKHGEAVHSFIQTKIKVKGKFVDNQTEEPLELLDRIVDPIKALWSLHYTGLFVVGIYFLNSS